MNEQMINKQSIHLIFKLQKLYSKIQKHHSIQQITKTQETKKSITTAAIINNSKCLRMIRKLDSNNSDNNNNNNSSNSLDDCDSSDSDDYISPTPVIEKQSNQTSTSFIQRNSSQQNYQHSKKKHQSRQHTTKAQQQEQFITVQQIQKIEQQKALQYQQRRSMYESSHIKCNLFQFLLILMGLIFILTGVQFLIYEEDENDGDDDGGVQGHNNNNNQRVTEFNNNKNNIMKNQITKNSIHENSNRHQQNHINNNDNSNDDDQTMTITSTSWLEPSSISSQSSSKITTVRASDTQEKSNSNSHQLGYQQQHQQQQQQQNSLPSHQISQYQLQFAEELLRLNGKYYNNAKKDTINSNDNDRGIDNDNSLKKQQTDESSSSPQQKQTKLLIDKEYQYYQDKYELSKIEEEISFCVIVPSYNNPQQIIIRNINSILEQQYTNYHIIFIEDGPKTILSSKKQQQQQQQQQQQSNLKNHASQIIKQRYLQWSKLYDRSITLDILNNHHKQGRVKNVYKASHQYCKKGQIMMVVDGDDQLIGRQVFKVINAQYQRQNKQFLVVYSNNVMGKFSSSQPKGKVGYSLPYGQDVLTYGSYRSRSFRVSNLRTFLVDLYWQIPKQQLMIKNQETDQLQWIQVSGDSVEMYPILEMAQQRVLYLNDLLYWYNYDNGQSDNQLHRIYQQKVNDLVRKRQKFKRYQKEVYWMMER